VSRLQQSPVKTLLIVLESGTDDQADIVAYQRQIGLHTEITALDLAANLETGRVFMIERIDASGVELDLERHRLGNAVEDEIARDNGGVLARLSDFGRREQNFGVLCGVKPVAALQLAVELRVAGRNRAGRDVDFQRTVYERFGARLRLPETFVNSPYQVVNPMCETLNNTRVWLGSTE